MQPSKPGPVEQNPAVTEAVEAIRRGLGEKLKSVSLVGAALPPTRHTGIKPSELLAVVETLPVDALTRLAKELKGASAAGIKVQVLTEWELLRSADVYTLEFAEYRARHVLLYGREPLEQLLFTDAELRRSLEQALRSLSRQLRRCVLYAASGVGPPSEAMHVVFECIDRLAIISHHALTLFGEPVPATEAELITALAKRAHADPTAVLGWIETIRRGELPDDPIGVLSEFLELIDAFVVPIDTLAAKHEPTE